MKKMFCVPASVAAGVLLMLGLQTAQAQIKVGVVTSSSGPVSMVGIPQRNTVALLPQEAGGQKITYISLDDASDPTAAVTAFKKLINEEQVDAIIGPSGTPGAMAALQFAAEAGVPMIAPVGSSAVILPMTEQKKWVFKTTANDEVNSQPMVDHMVKSGVKTAALLAVSDAFGQSWHKIFTEQATKAGIKVVVTEFFQRADTSLTAQALKVLAAKPDAVLVAAPGSSAVLPHTTLKDLSFKGAIYQTAGAALDPFLKLGGKKVEDALIGASLMLVLDEAPDANPIKKVAAKYVGDYRAKYGEMPATFGANVYDGGLLLQAAIPDALKAGKPGTREFRSALRDALEQTKNLVGAQGIYNITAQDHSGMGEDSIEMITVKNGQWKLLK